MNFKDYYSKQAAEYSKYRPTYPKELFKFLNSIVTDHNLALDCATGNGQAAIGLSEYFEKVIAIDASEAQIQNSFSSPKIEYRVAKAEETKLEPNSVDLVTIATAIHWVDLKLFYDEVNRILKEDGLIAIWTYGTENKINPDIDKVLNSFSKNVLHVHWDRGIEQVWNFEELEFPFQKFDSPEFEITKEWSCEEFMKFIYTWSSVHRYIEVHNENPVKFLKEDLKKIWGNQKREVKWKIKMKVGKK